MFDRATHAFQAAQKKLTTLDDFFLKKLLASPRTRAFGLRVLANRLALRDYEIGDFAPSLFMCLSKNNEPFVREMAAQLLKRMFDNDLDALDSTVLQKLSVYHETQKYVLDILSDQRRIKFRFPANIYVPEIAGCLTNDRYDVRLKAMTLLSEEACGSVHLRVTPYVGLIAACITGENDELNVRAMQVFHIIARNGSECFLEMYRNKIESISQLKGEKGEATESASLASQVLNYLPSVGAERREAYRQCLAGVFPERVITEPVDSDELLARAVANVVVRGSSRSPQ